MSLVVWKFKSQHWKVKISVNTKLQNLENFFWHKTTHLSTTTRKPAIQPKSFEATGQFWIFLRARAPAPRGGSAAGHPEVAVPGRHVDARQPRPRGSLEIFRKNVEKTSKNGENDDKINEKVKKHMEKIWKMMIFGAKNRVKVLFWTKKVPGIFLRK